MPISKNLKYRNDLAYGIQFTNEVTSFNIAEWVAGRAGGPGSEEPQQSVPCAPQHWQPRL